MKKTGPKSTSASCCPLSWECGCRGWESNPESSLLWSRTLQPLKHRRRVRSLKGTWQAAFRYSSSQWVTFTLSRSFCYTTKILKGKDEQSHAPWNFRVEGCANSDFWGQIEYESNSATSESNVEYFFNSLLIMNSRYHDVHVPVFLKLASLIMRYELLFIKSTNGALEANK